MDILIIALATAAAVWYLYRQFAKTAKPGDGACGCSGCGGCSASPRKSAES
jgi:hypothetical protein